MKRRDFVKTMAMSGVAVAAHDLIGELLAQTPQGRVLESKFKGLSDVALFHAGTARRDGALVTTAGRVFGVTALGANLDGACGLG